MYEMSRNTSLVLDYLKCEIYGGLPFTLFDRYLWFYSEIEELVHKLAYGKPVPYSQLYIHAKKQDVIGVAYLHLRDNEAELLIDVKESVASKSMIKELLDKLTRQDLIGYKISKMRIVVSKNVLAEQIKQVLNQDYLKGGVKFYSQKPVAFLDDRVREMHKDDEYLLDKLPTRVWGGYQFMLESGYRFFGLIDGNELLSMCGLSRLTAFQNQIIGVETFNDRDRQKGYAKAVCSLAMCTALRDTNIVTWSTNLNNVASCRTAESLGFRPYYSFYTFDLDVIHFT